MRKPEEVEVKLALLNASAVRSALRKNGFRVHKSRVFEENIVLDDSDGSLKARAVLLRVRSAGKTITCTYKGESRPGIHKRREEREFHADNLEECLALFSGIGFERAFRYDKYRTEYARPGDPGVVTVDETPIGVFMELEGPARWIDRTAKLLGFSRADYILSSYVRLYTEWCAEYGIESKEMTFSRRRPR